MVHLVGALHVGKFVWYSSMVFDEDPGSPEIAWTPPLYSFTQLTSMSLLFDTKPGKLHCTQKVVMNPVGQLELGCYSASRQSQDIGPSE